MILKKESDEKAPPLLKIGVIINGWFLLSPLINILRVGNLDLLSIFMGLVQIIVLIAISLEKEMKSVVISPPAVSSSCSRSS